MEEDKRYCKTDKTIVQERTVTRQEKNLLQDSGIITVVTFFIEASFCLTSYITALTS
jgi:hypothetical protein